VGDGTGEARLETARARRRGRDSPGGDGAGGGAVARGRGCLERAVSREPSRDGALETARRDGPGGRRPRGEMTWEAAQRDGASETARTRRLGAGDGAGEVEMARARRSRVGDGAGREMERWRVQGRVSYSPLNRLEATHCPRRAWERVAETRGYPSRVRCWRGSANPTPDPYPWDPRGKTRRFAQTRELPYVQWFSPLTQSRQQLSDVQDLSLVQGWPSSCLHHPYRCYTTQCASYPKFGPIAPRHWTALSVLDECPTSM